MRFWRPHLPVLLAGLCACAGLDVRALASELKPLVVAPLSTSEGLPQGTVMATRQDSQGFVWLGTEDGLVRFDGHELHRYAYAQDSSNGLPGNFVDAIVEDVGGDLWIGIKGAGLARWHRSSDTFSVYRHDPQDPNSLASDAVRSVLVDSKGLIWIGTLNAGVDVLDPGTGRIAHLRHDAARADSLIDDGVVALTEDRAGRVWVGTKNGLDRWRFDGASFVHDQPAANGPPPLAGKKITQVVEDGSGDIWVGTEEAGLYLLDSSETVQRSFQHDATPSSLGSNYVLAILKDRGGRLWVGTAEGLDLFDAPNQQFLHYRHDKEVRDSLSDSFVMSLYEDRSGLIWIGTKSGGVDRWNPHSWELGGRRPAWLDGKIITSFADAGDHQLWIGSVNGGLVRLNPDSGEASDIDDIVKSPNALGDRRIMSLLMDRHGTLWIGTMKSGLKVLTGDGRIASIPVARGDAHSLSAAGIMTIFEAQNGLIWIGTRGGGANVLNPNTGLIRQLPFGTKDPGAISSENVTSFVEDAHGNLWIGTEAGLDLATSDGTVIRVFRHDPASAGSLSASAVYSLATDAGGRLWVATNGGGLNLVTGSSQVPSAIKFKSISNDSGLASGTLYSALGDSAGGMWMSGNAGLMHYDPVKDTVRAFHREDGLQGEEFNFGAYFKTRDGRLCFGGTGGYNIFRPELLAENRGAAPRVVLTRVDILGVPAGGATPYWLLKQISLDYHASIVSFDFAALDFASPNRSRFEYKMAGLSDTWIDLGTQHRLTLTNLAPGEHVLQVRAANADSLWSTEPLRLSVHKDAAPWKSPAAYTAYVLTGFAVLLAAIFVQRQKWRQAAASQSRLELQVALRTQQLQETNQRLLVANEAKSNFLARMSHELRTPMNGVLGMTELLERTTLSAIQSRQTQTIKSSARTLLQILNDLLDLSKVQAGKIELELLPVDLTQLSEECASLFASTAQTKGLEVVVCPPLDERRLLGDPLRIRQVLMNLIANAVKFTEAGEVIIDCQVDDRSPDGAGVQISISDTGIGLSPEAIAKIFDPFTQADETTTRRFGGSGLGLTICAELVKLMGGSIDVASEPRVGSRFTVTLSLPFAVAAPPAKRSPLHDRPVRIVTRRGSLAESLRRYVSRLDPASVTWGQPAASGRYQPSELIVWDADSCGAALQSYLEIEASGRGPIVVVATALAVEEYNLERSIPAANIVTKPVYGDSLHAALLAAFAPAVAPSAADREAGRSANALHAHVLVVEDEPVNAAVAQGYLAELGCSSVWVNDGTSAIARNSIERFDVILMDLNMPGLDGFAAASLIREREQPGRRVPIIALTATEASACRDRCIQAGMDDVLSKPYSVSQCAALLRGLTKRAAASRVDLSVMTALRNLGRRDQPPIAISLIAVFKRSSTAAIQEIAQALGCGDFSRVAAVCHKIKSAAGNVGAMEFAALLHDLEQHCEARGAAAGDAVPVDAVAANALLDRLLAAHPALLDSLERLSQATFA